MFVKPQWRRQNVTSPELSPAACLLLATVIAAMVTALIVALGTEAKAAPQLAARVSEQLEVSGVENPVTAVLLNFRSYDTLLEIAVLLIVAVALMPATVSAPQAGGWIQQHEHRPVTPMLAALLQWLVPLALVVGGYLLWTGAYAPGGAFQAGSVIAAAGVALSLAGQHRFSWHGATARALLLLGLLVFVLVAAANALITGTTLQYPVDAAGRLILLVELAATVSIAAILLLLFTRLKALADAGQEEPRS